MNDDHLDDLLRPSLDPQRKPTPIYSVRANFLLAFFGGGIAIAIFSAVNSARLGRLRGDVWLNLSGGLFFAAATAALSYLRHTGFDFAPYEVIGSSTARMALRALSLGFFGILYLRHQDLFRASELAGMDPPSPWKAAIAAVAVSVVVGLICVALGKGLAR